VVQKKITRKPATMARDKNRLKTPKKLSKAVWMSFGLLELWFSILLTIIYFNNCALWTDTMSTTALNKYRRKKISYIISHI